MAFRRRIIQSCIRLAFVYVCWLAMMATHELGHIVFASMSGGTVAGISVPLIGFSRTDLSHNPSPLFVEWGGFLIGCIIPLSMWLVVRAWFCPVCEWFQFFTGFCFVVNGAYIAFGSIFNAGDAHDMLRHGSPVWLLISVGSMAATTGLYCWHTLGLRARKTLHPGRPDEALV